MAASLGSPREQDHLLRHDTGDAGLRQFAGQSAACKETRRNVPPALGTGPTLRAPALRAKGGAVPGKARRGARFARPSKQERRQRGKNGPTVPLSRGEGKTCFATYHRAPW